MTSPWFYNKQNKNRINVIQEIEISLPKNILILLGRTSSGQQSRLCKRSLVSRFKLISNLSNINPRSDLDRVSQFQSCLLCIRVLLLFRRIVWNNTSIQIYMQKPQSQLQVSFLQCFGAGAARSRPFWLEPEPKKLRSFGSGSIIKEDE